MNWTWVLARLGEPSTWTGLAAVLGSAAVFGLSTGTWGAVMAAGMAVFGAVGMIKKEKAW
jgi:hypothetical protein